MAKLKLTEVLSEINLVKKKIETKRSGVLGNLVRASHVDDPYQKDGGALEHNKKEVQAIKDLQKRLVKLRAAISRANLDNQITIGDSTQSIHDWLIWKREVAAGAIKFTSDVFVNTKRHFDHIAKQPQVYTPKLENGQPGEQQLIKYVDQVGHTDFAKENEALNDQFQTLDGKLSLANATIEVEVAD